MRVLISSIILLLALLAKAQINDINPSVQWKYVRSQELILLSGSVYSFEFPAEKGYDYLVNLTHDDDSAGITISVTDLQYGEVASKTDSSNSETMTVDFRVSAHGTYILVVQLIGDQEGVQTPVKLNIIRREITEF